MLEMCFLTDESISREREFERRGRKSPEKEP
jgi:hypothetical protein